LLIESPSEKITFQQFGQKYLLTHQQEVLSLPSSGTKPRNFTSATTKFVLSP